MRKIYKIFFMIILICSITFSSFAVDLNELQEQKNEIQTQLQENNEKKKEIDEEITENLSQIQSIDASISESESKLSELNENIDKINEKISKTEQELKIVKEKYDSQKELLDSRLIAMYEMNNTGYLDVVLGVKSVSEFISTYYLIGEMTEYDMDLIETVAEEKKEIEEKKEFVDKQKDELVKEKKNQQRAEIELSNTKVVRNIYLSKLTEEERKIQDQIDQYNSEINQIEAEIKGLVLIACFGEEYQGGPMVWPIPGHKIITSQYGMRVHPVTGIYKLHTGVDIGAYMGDNFNAMARGIVVKAEFNPAYGNMVILDHGGGIQTLYAHGSEIVAQLGQEVNAGDTVLKVGSTGYSTGPHAHFEVRVNGTTVNPLNYVAIPE